MVAELIGGAPKTSLSTSLDIGTTSYPDYIVPPRRAWIAYRHLLYQRRGDLVSLWAVNAYHQVARRHAPATLA